MESTRTTTVFFLGLFRAYRRFFRKGFIPLQNHPNCRLAACRPKLQKRTESRRTRTMESRKELAAEKKRCGSHNCTQSVLCTYCDLTGLDEETIKHAGNCFAAGMGNGEGTCGSIVGAGIVYGLAVRDRAKAVKGMRQIMEKFQERNGATCRMFVNGTAYIIGR